jgi:TonB-linked SusC/RagA family outer membrane protein
MKSKRLHSPFFFRKLLFKSLIAMKITFALILVSALSAYAKGFSQDNKVTINMHNAPVVAVLKAIEKQTLYKFVYSNDLFPGDYKVDVTANKLAVSEVLAQVLDKRGFTYTLIDEKTIVLTKASAEGRNIAIHGTVTTEKGDPLEGVTITVDKPKINAVTNTKGQYNITADQNAIITFSFIGYESQIVSINSRNEINVTLRQGSSSLNDVLVIGYGTVKKSDLTGSVASLASDKVTQVKAVSNVAQALQGQVAGVQVIQRSGQPGEYVSIKVRGTNSIAGGNDPLYVVDGLPLDGLSAQLNPDDIERIEVLKDASATAIYGSRGANGVIMITTKRGKEGKVQVSYNGYFGVQTLRKKIKLINAQEFAQLQNEAAKNDGNALPWSQTQIDSLKGKGTDWQDLVYKPANVQDHDLAISGGSATTKYYTSFGYYNQDGIIANSNYTRYSFRGNLDQKINNKINFNVNLSLQDSKYFEALYSYADYGGVPFQTMVMPPTVGVRDAAGKYTVFTGVPWGQTNPVGMANDLWKPTNSLRVIGSTGLTYEIIKGLKLKVSAGIDGSWNKTDYYAPSTISFGQPSGVASKSYSNGATFINENLLNYNRSFKNNNVDAIAGVTYQSSHYENLSSGNAMGFTTDLYQNNNIQSATTPGLPSTGYTDNKLVSYLGRINYNYSGKYFATFTGRYDGSSKFGENNKFAFFPSGALAWRVSQENFMRQIKSVSNLKLRTSYGLSGNQAIAPYQTLASMSNTQVIFNNRPDVGYIQSSLDNKNLKWETTKQFDLGIDLGLFNERIQFTADYYNKKTSDLLLNVTLPPSSGFGTVLENVGAVQNRGFEFQLTTNNNIGNVKWTAGLTYTHNRTKVLDLGKDADGNPITYKEIGPGGNWFPMIVGQSMSQLYGYKVLGVYQTDAEAAKNGEPTKKAGDYKFWDANGDGVVDGNDRVTLSHLEPKFTFGFNNTFAYKNFDLTLLFVGSYGNDVVNEFRKYNITMNGNWTPTQAAFDQRWRGEGTSNSIDKPSMNSGSSIRDYANSLWVENGSYLKLRDITLGYNFSPASLKALQISAVRLYVSLQNYITFTKYSGYDPEASWNITAINGWDRGVYPAMKSITGGLRVNF